MHSYGCPHIWIEQSTINNSKVSAGAGAMFRAKRITCPIQNRIQTTHSNWVLSVSYDICKISHRFRVNRIINILRCTACVGLGNGWKSLLLQQIGSLLLAGILLFRSHSFASIHAHTIYNTRINVFAFIFIANTWQSRCSCSKAIYYSRYGPPNTSMYIQLLVCCAVNQSDTYL